MFAKFAILLAVAQVATVALASAKEIPVEVSARLHFLETFDAGSDVFESGKWTRSSVDKYADQPVLIKTVQTPMPGFETDKGLELTQEHKYYGVSTRFPSPLSFTDFDTSKGQDFVVQYELKLEESLTCSGAYLKLPRVTEGLDLSIMDNNTPYTVMFGVDKCGTDTNKVHFILQFQNPLTGEWEEKHATEVPTPKLDKKSHLYTLLVTRGNNYEIFIDKKSAKKGSLFTHMKPSIAPPAEIPDPSDTKPSDWMDESTMPDPDAVKPDDWDESQPRKVPDAKATKPANWDEKAPRQIPDPSAIKPEDWDDGEDGEWEPPLVDNPACDNPGCGPWSPPLVSNPLYKGKWVPKNVPNPAYKGPWAQKNITNPGFYEVKDPYSSLPPVAGLAIEVLANNAGIHFDNLVVGRSLDAAFAVADSTFVPKSASEAVREKEKKKRKTEKKIKDKKASAVEKNDWREYGEALVLQGQEFVLDNLYAVIGTAAVLMITLMALVFTSSSSPSSPSTPASAPAAAPAPAPSSPSRGAKAKAAEKKKKEEEEEEEEEEETEKEVKTPTRRSRRG